MFLWQSSKSPEQFWCHRQQHINVFLAGRSLDAPRPSGVSLQLPRLAGGGGLCGGLENWLGREAPLSLGSGSRLSAPGSQLLAPSSRLQASRSRFLVPRSRLPAPGAELQLKRRGAEEVGVRTLEAASSDPLVVRCPAETGGRTDGAAAPRRSPAPRCIRLREGGGEAARGGAWGSWGNCGTQPKGGETTGP